MLTAATAAPLTPFVAPAPADLKRADALRAAALDTDLARVLRVAAEVLVASASVVALPGPDGDLATRTGGSASFWDAVATTPAARLTLQRLVARVVASRAPLVLPDASAHPPEAGAAAGAVAYLLVPLAATTGEVIGALCVLDHAPRAWTDGQLRLLTDLAAGVVTEVELRVVVRDASARKHAEAEAALVRELSMLVADARDAGRALMVALARVCVVTQWPYAEVWVPDASGRRLERGHTWHGGAPALEAFAAASAGVTFRRGEGLPGRVWAAGAPVWVPDVSAEPNLPRASLARSAGLKAGLAVPVLAGDELVAVVSFHLAEARVEDPDLARLVTAAAGQLGSALRRKRDQDELRASEERHRRLLDLLPDGIIVHQAGRVVYANAALAAILGAPTPASLVGLRALDLVHPGDRELVRDRVAALGAGLAVAPLMEERFLRVDGTPVQVEVAGVQVPHGGGFATMALVRDVTARKRASAERDRLTAIIEATTDVVTMVDTTGRLIYVNRAGRRLLELPASGELGDLRADDIHPPGVAATIAEQCVPAVERDGTWRGETTVATRDGRVVPVSQVVVGHRGPTGTIDFMSAVMRDISAEEAAVAALRDSEAQRRAVVDQAAVGIVMLDLDGVVVEANAAFERITGFGAAELVGRRSGTLSPAEDAAITREPVREIKAGLRKSATVEKRFICRDGALVWASLTISLVETGGARYLLGIVEDITDRKRMAVALEREREFLGAVLQSLSEGIVACDAEGRLTLFNRATREFHGLPEVSDLRPEHWAGHYNLYHADGATPMAMAEVPLVRALNGEVVRDTEMVIAATGHPNRHLLASGTRFTDAAGRVLGAVIAMHDVTERREVERRKSEFVSTVSHELRTPLTAIKGSLALLEHGVVGALPDKAAAMVHVAASNTERLIRLVTDVLDLDKIEAGELEYAMTPLEPAELVRAAAEGIQGMAAGARIEVVTQLGATTAVVGDRDRLLQVLTNLLSNAVKFSPPDSTVVLSASPVAGAVRFTVENTGPGIPPHQLGLLFQKFRQLGVTEATRRGGTGLGLAITKAIVEQHGGRVGVASEPGRRTRFWCDIPCAKGER